MGKGLPKKYAKMGFKKGWAAYKRTKKKSRKGGRKKSSPRKTKRKGGYVARRKYTRRRSYRRSKNINIPLGGIAIGLSTATALGGDEALGYAMQGDLQSALGRLGQNSVADVVAASIPVFVYGMLKKTMGSPTLFKIGKIHVKL